MKQVVQDLKKGNTYLEDVPAPTVQPGHVLIRARRSLISLGTEKMLVDFGRAGFLAKARQQPEKVKQVLDKMKTEGIRPTVEAVFNKLDQPLPLGYCHVGEVIGMGEGVPDIKLGDRVVSNGPHAEIVNIPHNLVAKIPDQVDDDTAAFTVIASIGLQGIRLINPTFGETIVVFGLGLIGLLTAQLLKANGNKVVGIDLDPQKLELAKQWGIDTIHAGEGDVIKRVHELTHGIGADGVVITASTSSNELVHQAAQMSRKRGRIVLVGVVGLQLNRADFYEKELSFQVSCSYGPGRYDDDYELKGHDYPIGFVRWTEKRNFEAILEAMATGALKTSDLVTTNTTLENVEEVYAGLGKQNDIATLIRYNPGERATGHTVTYEVEKRHTNKTGIALVGAGNFTRMTLLPVLKKLNAPISTIVSAKGLNGTTLAKKYGISRASTSYTEVLKEEEVGSVIITTRHHLHAEMVVEGLEAGKHVFVEKPLAIRMEEIDRISEAWKNSERQVMVGFNRRYSPYSMQAKKLLGNNPGPINVLATMNVGYIPDSSWVQDMQQGGGRIIGEACHMIDLITYFAGSTVSEVMMSAMGKHPEESTDNAVLLLKYKNGSQGVVNYFSNGSKSYPKERVEIYHQGKNILIDNFQSIKGFGYKGFRGRKGKLDKGHTEQFRQYLDFIQSGDDQNLIPYSDILNTSRTAILAIESLKSGSWMKV